MPGLSALAWLSSKIYARVYSSEKFLNQPRTIFSNSGTILPSLSSRGTATVSGTLALVRLSTSPLWNSKSLSNVQCLLSLISSFGLFWSALLI